MNIKDLQQRVNDKRRAIGLVERTDAQLGMLKVDNGDVSVVRQYPNLIYRVGK